MTITSSLQSSHARSCMHHCFGTHLNSMTTHTTYSYMHACILQEVHIWFVYRDSCTPWGLCYYATKKATTLTKTRTVQWVIRELLANLGYRWNDYWYSKHQWSMTSSTRRNCKTQMNSNIYTHFFSMLLQATIIMVWAIHKVHVYPEHNHITCGI